MRFRLVVLGALILLTGFLLVGFAIEEITQTFGKWVSEGHMPPPPQHRQAIYIATSGGFIAFIGLVVCIAGIVSETR